MVFSKRKQSLFPKEILAIFALILAILFLNGTFNMYRKYRDAKEKRDIAEVELMKLTNREQELTREIERLSTDIGLEEELRTRYPVVKEGEKLIVILDAPENSDMLDGEGSSFFDFLKGLFR